MPRKDKTYKQVLFTQEIIKEATEGTEAGLKPQQKKNVIEELTIKLSSQERWTYDNEDEFFADYRKRFEYAFYNKLYVGTPNKISFSVFCNEGYTNSEVCVSLSSRSAVESVFNILEANIEKCHLPEPPPPPSEKIKIRIFIGHGRNPQWQELKDHLRDKHGIEVEHYEYGARAGLTIQQVLSEMLTKSSFAFLVLTGEDVDATGKLHARENVIHELGLFQGRLGWKKAIALVEDGVAEFSNIHGINQIRFSKGNIKETFGDVLATIKREFPER